MLVVSTLPWNKSMVNEKQKPQIYFIESYRFYFRDFFKHTIGHSFKLIVTEIRHFLLARAFFLIVPVNTNKHKII